MTIDYTHPHRHGPAATDPATPAAASHTTAAAGRSIPQLFPEWYRSVLAAGDRPETSENMVAVIERTAVMITVGAAESWLAQDPAALAEFHRRFDNGGIDPDRVPLIPDDMIDFLLGWNEQLHEQLRTLVTAKLPIYLNQYLTQNPGRLPMMTEWEDEPVPVPEQPGVREPEPQRASTSSGLTGVRYLLSLAEQGPACSETINWKGVADAVADAGYDIAAAIAVSYCSFGMANIEALIDSVQLTILFPEGIISTSGKLTMVGRKLKYNQISFRECRGFGPDEHTDPRGLGKFCIEFVGAGNILLGRLQWGWKAKRFRDSRQEIMHVAEERDRFLAHVEALFS
jgi:hypothetical protein